MDELKKQDNKLKDSLNITKSKLDDVIKNYKPFNNKEVQLLQEIARTKWATMQEKVNNLAEEVFNEVV